MKFEILNPKNISFILKFYVENYCRTINLVTYEWRHNRGEKAEQK